MIHIFVVYKPNGTNLAEILARFRSLKKAQEYTFEHAGTEIKKIEALSFRLSTNKQRLAVRWAEKILLSHGEKATFTGNINSYDDCNEYLGIWLELAKEFDYYDKQVILENPLDDDYYD